MSLSIRAITSTLAILFVCNFASSAAATNEQSENIHMMTAKEQKEVLKKLKKQINEQYIDKTVAQKLSSDLEKLSQNKILANPVDAIEFAESITLELQSTSGDKHLRLEYSPQSEALATAQKSDNEISTDFASEQEKAMWDSHNMGFDKMERLPFNIGYLKISAFAPMKHAEPMIAAAFTLLNRSNALILDLRGNFGGYEYTSGLLASYLLDKKTHLINMHWRNNNRIEQRWSQAKVNGPRYAIDKPVYILVDENTFSAGEVFSHVMKHLKRAKIVGAQTAGASNAGEDYLIDKNFSAFIPNRRMTNAVTGKGFEGVGVKPDIKTTSELALNLAQVDYLETLYEITEHPALKKRIKARVELLK
ncbi:S41 family peptidase [Aliikangiella sp. G2MR2-5]|uniref:S41 family peptidase n=1 Tax=Aliikangiella sp. G2MR2-5 TaxID=2788943 RepID=UPI0018AC1FFC|nr:S41 family peptidase [Aliikangiella sp. G2MR2-5]